MARVVVAGFLVAGGPGERVRAQAAASTRAVEPARVTVPFLANSSKPADLDFQSGECDVEASGRVMTCRFQQVFLTVSPITPDTCLITTNRYERVYQRDGEMHWTSRGEPVGTCGTVEVSTLRGDGGIRWTLEMRTEVTTPAAAPACAALAQGGDTMSWHTLRRPLPCAFVQPGAILP